MTSIFNLAQTMAMRNLRETIKNNN